MAYGITIVLMIKNKNDLKKTFLNDLLFPKINIGSPLVCDGL